jgi:hypothetical protein
MQQVLGHVVAALRAMRLPDTESLEPRITRAAELPPATR